jgi:hypothetical protein
MPMVPPPVPSPVLGAARLSKELAALAVPGLVPVLGILRAPDRVTKPEPEAVAPAAALAPALATPLVQVPAAEAAPVAVGTRTLFGDK